MLGDLAAERLHEKIRANPKLVAIVLKYLLGKLEIQKLKCETFLVHVLQNTNLIKIINHQVLIFLQ